MGNRSSESREVRRPDLDRRWSSATGSSRGRGIGRLAERLIVEHSDWTYRRIADEVNARIEGATASEKSVRWYASQMRKRGQSNE